MENKYNHNEIRKQPDCSGKRINIEITVRGLKFYNFSVANVQSIS